MLFVEACVFESVSVCVCERERENVKQSHQICCGREPFKNRSKKSTLVLSRTSAKKCVQRERERERERSFSITPSIALSPFLSPSNNRIFLRWYTSMNEFNIPLKTQTEKNGFCSKCERKKNGGKTKAGEML